MALREALAVEVAILVLLTLPVQHADASVRPAVSGPDDLGASLIGTIATFEHRCTSPQLPLDGAPLGALSMDAEHMRRRVTNPPTGMASAKATLQLLVNEHGWVTQARVENAAGSRRTVQWLLRDVETWRFKPRQLDGKAVCAWGRYAVTLEDGFVDDDAKADSAVSPR